MLTFYSHNNNDVVWDRPATMDAAKFKWFLNVMLDEDYGDKQTYLNCANEEEVKIDIEVYIANFIESVEYEGGLKVVNRKYNSEITWEFKKNDYLVMLYDEYMDGWRTCVENNFGSLVDKWLKVYSQF